MTGQTQDDNQRVYRNKFIPQLELIIWFVFAASMYIYPYSRGQKLTQYAGFNMITFLLEFYYIIVFSSILVILFPIMFKLIFGFYPFQYLRLKIQLKAGSIVENKGKFPIQITYQVPEEIPKDYKEACISESKLLSEKIFTRAGVYLLAGTFIAFMGIGFFYSPLFSKVETTNKEISLMILEYLPRFGALFFIEFIALFFLKQFRIMHEEYRYYESIKRKRRDNFNLLQLIEKYQDKPELSKLIITIYTDNSNYGKLNKDETTQILETQKIQNQETDIFNKVIELAKDFKGK